MQICHYVDSGTTSSTEPIDHTNETTGGQFNPVLQGSSKKPTSSSSDDYTLDSASAELVMSNFRGLVESLFRAPMVNKRKLRAWIVDDLAVGRRLIERVECVLEHAVTSTKPSRLDDAIDILDQAKVDLTEYLRWARSWGDLDCKPDDAIYVLVRAAGRRSDNAAMFVVPWALKSDRASIREAAVEALADWGTDPAISKLRWIAKADDDSSVRKTAEEALEYIAED